MNKSTITIQSESSGKLLKIPCGLYDIIMNENYDTPQKAYMVMSWYKSNEADKFGLSDPHVESMVLEMFKGLLRTRQEYRHFIQMYEKRYGKAMKYNEWNDEYKDVDLIRQIMANAVRKGLEEGMSEKDIKILVNEKMKQYEKIEKDDIKQLLKDPAVIKELIKKRKEDLVKLSEMKVPEEGKGKPVYHDIKGHKFVVV